MEIVKKSILFAVLIVGISICLIAIPAYSLDYPHTSVNNIGCNSCHYVYGSESSLLIEGLSYGQNIDDTQYNALCWSCHNDIQADYVRTHSSLLTNNGYGDWSVECRTCHYPHSQKQIKTYGSDSYLTSGTSTGVTATTLTKTGAGWTDDEYNGLVLIPNVSKNKYGYKITDNTSDMITVEGPINLSKGSSGDTFAVIYGKIIKSTIKLDDIIGLSKSGDKTVRFFNNTGTNSFADGDSTYNGVCEVCHTQTVHFSNDGLGSNQLHTNVGAPAGTDCISCHSHTSGFAHGGGEGVGCDECHGHDPGYGGATGGGGTYETHSTHTENDDTHELKGPNVACSTCHNTSSYPDFTDGVSYADYKTGTPTTVCNTCHSPNGTYDGVSDATVGAKNNWTNGVYEADGSLTSGKEKWCATCHDETPSVISTITAPNVIGDEDGSYTYGTGWGYYKSGHGLSAGSTYPESGGVVSGAGKGCLECHISTVAHVDGEARTFNDDNSSTDQSDEYRIGYRLKQIGGEEPMVIPKNNDGNAATDYRICMQVGCHYDDGTGPFLSSSNLSTNFRIGNSPGDNYHNYHLDFNNAEYSPDWDGGGNVSEPTCVVCHNVHGSKRLVMLRDGTLTGATDGFEIWYYNPDIVTSGNPPSPEDLPLSASTGTIYQRNSPQDFCAASCHSNNIATTTRNPFQDVSQAPTLDWTGETNYTSDGANPNSGESGSNFVFRVKYTDTNNDAPTFIQVWVDEDDDATYQSDEKYDMAAVNPVDSNYTDGKFYTKTLSLSSAGDNTFNYRFYATNGTEATGDPTSNNTVGITNSAPTLTWTSESYYVSDGVNPDTGGAGASYVFRIKYTDADGTAPSVIQVWVDEDDDSVYQADEKYTMTVDGGDSDYTNGELYAKTLALSYVSDGSYNYRFYASDGTADATGSPISNSTVTVLSSANNPPTLEWAVATCLTDGVKPVSGLASGNFEFKIKYTDPDAGDGCPTSDTTAIQVWLDEDDSAAYEGDEKYNLVEDDASDTDCTDGKIYKVTRQIGYAGDGVYNYCFYSTDGTDTAIGNPVTTGSTVTVLSTTGRLGVRTGSETGPTWFGSIQDAIDEVNGTNTVLVYEGTYDEGTYLYFNGTDDNNTTVESVCGADSTIISNSGTVVLFQANTGSTLDGFTITGGTTGISLNGGLPTITNTKIYSISGRGIDTGHSGSTLTLTDSEVYSNTASGIYINGGTGHTITGTTIRDNSTTGVGGGVFTSGSTIFTDTTIKNNTATSTGGGVHVNGGIQEFYRCTITGNVASSAGGAINLGNSGAHASLENTIIADNQGTYGGVSFVNGGSFTAINSTFANNQATSTTGGAFSNNSGTITIRNSILWNNQAATDGQIIYFNSGTVVISDSIFNNDGDGDFTDVPYFYNGSPTVSGYTSEDDPLFVNESAGDYHIQSSSNAIDNANATYAPANDIDSEARPQSSADDIGADEYVSNNNSPVLTWTGETNYASDGVNPNSAAGESSFEFRVTYTDADDTAPTSIQLWIDEDDDGTYESGEKYDMSAINIDTVYTDGKLYTKTLTLSFAGDTNLKYRFYASDGTVDATGTPISDSTVIVTNNVPTFAWTGEGNYTTDGVNPDSGTNGSNFDFRIDYTDLDNAAPTYMEVWVDEDDGGTYSAGEKYSMTATDGGDLDYSDGKRYSKTLAISYAGDGALIYRFASSDGTADATGTPTSDSTLTVTNAPTLGWTGESNYVSDGVNPDTGATGSSFEFRVKYTDAGNTAPTVIQVWVDEDDDSIYQADEKFAMTIEGGDSDYTNGELYTKSMNISDAGNGVLNYRFYATNGSDDAIGSPTSDSTLAINYAPALTWTGEANYIADGVDPNSAATGSNFTFRVKYTDQDNEAPTSIHLWLDEDDDSIYQADEKYVMTIDGGDSDYTNGELYAKTLAVSSAGDDTFNYRFYATDGTDDATGDPATGSSISITSSLAVPGQYATITLAINAASSGDTITVSDGTYSENIDYGGKNITIISVNGSSSTTVQGDGSNAAVVTFSNGETSSAVLDGFTVNNQATACSTRGAYISNSSAPTIQNSIFEGNTPNCNYDGAAIYINGGSATIDNTTFGSSGLHNTDQYGAAIYATSLSAALTITDSTFNYNDGDLGGAIYLTGNSQTTSITDTTFSNNTVTLHGAAIYSNGSPLEITGGSISSNTSTQDGAGIYLTGASATLTISGSTSISSNNGRIGGAIYANGTGAISITDATIDSNIATSSSGGIYMANTNGASIITNTSISGNQSTGLGAGLYFGSSATTSLTLTNCNVDNNFTTNTGSYDGGGMYLSGANVTVNVNGGTVNGNTTRGGGGINALGGVDLVVSGTTINSNDADSNGGGISIAGTIDYTSTLDISKCIISGNVADDNAGGIYVGGYATATITNCTITGNLVELNFDGGGVYDGGTTAIYSSTIAGNYAKRYGGGLRATSNTIVKNSIIWGNDAGTSGPQITGTPSSITYTNIDGGGFAGTGNIDSAPVFVNEQASTSATPTTAGNFHINSLVSPVVDTANATDSPAEDIDGDSRPLGSADDMGSDEFEPPAAAVPTLAWTGETNYTTDGVDPNSGAGGSDFVFMVKYTDVNNDNPSSIQVWVDRNDDGDYLDANEKENMTETDGADTNKTDGKLYTKTLAISIAGDNTLSYRFYAADGVSGDATGTPTSDSTLTVTNNAPTLAWTGETNYSIDGVDPNSSASGSDFIFRIDYTDADNTAPSSIQVWIDRNDDGDYLDANEKEDMTATDGGDTTYTDGKRYTKTLTLSSAGDNSLNYRFYASDGTADATGTPTKDNTITVGGSNNAPALAWTGETDYVSDGVDPDSGPGGSNFIFRIKYTDDDDEAPTSIQVWIDRNDDGDYLDANEKENMTGTDGGDTTYTDGKLYAVTLTVSYAGDGSLPYLFYATDGTDPATGTPASVSTLTVVDALEVPGEYASIAAAITASSSGDVILVSDGTYGENIDYGGKNITIQSVNGSASTTITGSGANDAVISFENSETSSAILDGFTIDNQAAANSNTRGIVISGGAQPTIRNSIIQGNATLTWQTAAGIYISGGGVTIEDTIIGGSIDDKNSCSQGCGLYATSSSYDITITDSTITFNYAVNNGAGIYLTGITGTTTITNTTIDSNTGGDNAYGSGIYTNGSTVSMTGGSVSSNSGGLNRGGGGIYLTSATATFTATTINSNYGGSYGGGGILMEGTSPSLTLTKCYVQGNYTSGTGNGGGISVAAGTATITNSVIAGNHTGNNYWSSGGGIYNNATMYIYHSTIADNYAIRRGGGIFVNTGGTTTIDGSLLWDNIAADANTADIEDDNATTITYSAIESGKDYTDGGGNVTSITGTVFTTTAPAGYGSPTTSGNYHIKSDAVEIIDSADPSSTVTDDIDGDSRVGSTNDMGADER